MLRIIVGNEKILHDNNSNNFYLGHTMNVVKFLVFLSLSFNSFAQGEKQFYCATKDQSVEFLLTTTGEMGFPLSKEVLVNTEEKTEEYELSQVVGYWNLGSTLNFALKNKVTDIVDYIVETNLVIDEDRQYFSGILLSEEKYEQEVFCQVSK